MVMRADGPKAVDLHVGAQVRSLRKARSMSQTALAEALGLTFQQIQKYERGFNRISASTLYAISRVFGVSVGVLFDGLAGVDEPLPDPDTQARLTYAVGPDGARLYAKLAKIADDKQRMGVVEAVIDMALGFEGVSPPPASAADPGALRAALGGIGKTPDPNTPAGMRAALGAIPKTPLTIRKPGPKIAETPLRAALDAMHQQRRAA